MPPKIAKEAVIFVVNTGRGSAEIAENENQSFLDKAKNVVKQILERKIFLRKNDTTNVICFGTNETNNEVNIDNICQFESELRVPTWKIVDKVLKIKPTEQISNWVEALHVAIEFSNRTYPEFLGSYKIIIIDNFNGDQNAFETFEAEDVIKEVIESDIELMFISSSDICEETPDNLNLSQRLAAKVYRQLISQDIKCAFGQINDYLTETRFYKNPPVKPTPWKFSLEIGKISIPALSYVKVTEPSPFPSWKLTTRTDSVGFPPESEVDVKKTKEYIDRYRNVTEQENLIKGFKYGGTFIPFSDEDRDRAKFKDTVKSLIVRGFVKQEEVSLENWFGKGSHIIVPENDSSSKNKFYALLAVMKRDNYAAIVRKVYQKNGAPKMGLLFPRLEEGEIACFIHIGLPFVEERRILKPKEDVNLPSEEKQKDVDDYIDSMMLSADDERFQPGSFGNPFKQCKWDNLSYRALNSDSLPPMDQYLMKLISPPESLIEQSKSVIERLSQWVKPKPVIVKKKEKENEEDVKDVPMDEIKTEEEMMKAAEEAEKEIQKRDELFNEFDQSSLDNNDDLFNDF